MADYSLAQAAYDDGVQSLASHQHVIFYEQYEGRCHILRVLHHSRDLNPVFP